MNTLLQETIAALNAGHTILYPTDTVWGIGCDATNIDAVKKVYQLKKRDDSKALICLVSDIKMLNCYIDEIPKKAYEIITHSEKPTTIIYDKAIGLPENLIAKDRSIAIRVTNDEFCKQLIDTFGKPLVSTSANVSGAPTPKSFTEISKEILKGVGYVVNLYPDKQCENPSSIIKIEENGRITVIRK